LGVFGGEILARHKQDPPIFDPDFDPDDEDQEDEDDEEDDEEGL